MRRQVIEGITWRSAVEVSEQLLLVFFTAILARVLTKADFGLVAMALLVNRFVDAMTGVGFSGAVIQSPYTTPAQVSAVFFAQIGINLGASLACFFGAPLAASFFGQPALIPIVRAVGWLIFIKNLAFPETLLQKNLRFKGLSLLELGAMAAGNVIGIIMALRGAGVWALVARLLIHRSLYALSVWPMAGWRPTKPDFRGASKLFDFGLKMFGSNIFNYFSQNSAAVITGKLIGVEELGVFNIAYNLAVVPAQKMQSVLVSILAPAFCRMQGDLVGLRSNFYASLFSLSALFIPLMFGLSAVAGNLVAVVYGAKWEEAGVFLGFLAFVGLLKGVEHLLRSVILARGFASTVFRITVIETLVGLPLLAIGSFLGQVLGLVIAFLVTATIAFIFTASSAQRVLGESGIIFRATRRSLSTAVVMFLAVIPLGFFFSWPPPLLLGAQILLGIVVYAGLRVWFLTGEEKAIVVRWPLLRAVFT